ncbi:hypothetical protein SeseC_00818 [Streptococcus equi subsp. zooepidemicus ATCC 35246]|nr:hypothetical protein SeseC_00818 [Streptococcus equi subsp. zooepidemicus ATCC 35246]
MRQLTTSLAIKLAFGVVFRVSSFLFDCYRLSKSSKKA